MKRIQTLVFTILVTGLGVMNLCAPAIAQTSDVESADSITGQGFLHRDILLGDSVVGSLADEERAASEFLSFSSSPETTRELNKLMAEDWATETGTDPGQVQQLFDSGELQDAFTSRLHAAGFSTDRLDDVMAGYLIIMYEIAHDIDATPNAAAYPLVRDRVRSGLLRDPEVLAMTNTEKQGLSETLALLSMIASRSREDFIKAGDTRGLGVLQRNVYDTVIQFGLDITSVELTPEGFVAR